MLWHEHGALARAFRVLPHNVLPVLVLYPKIHFLHLFLADKHGASRNELFLQAVKTGHIMKFLPSVLIPRRGYFRSTLE